MLGPFVKKFQRHKEDFCCLVCGKDVKGTGYTNHCPDCLHSRHVDINPGDRAANCRGIMVPITKGVDGKGYYIVHRCKNCEIQKKNKIALFEHNDIFLKLPWHS